MQDNSHLLTNQTNKLRTNHSQQRTVSKRCHCFFEHISLVVGIEYKALPTHQDRPSNDYNTTHGNTNHRNRPDISFSARCRAIADWYVSLVLLPALVFPFGWTSFTAISTSFLHFRGGHTLLCSVFSPWVTDVFRGLPRVGLNVRAFDVNKCRGTCCSDAHA